MLAWSSARRGISDAVVAAVIGSFAYNATMTLGAARRGRLPAGTQVFPDLAAFARSLAP